MCPESIYGVERWWCPRSTPTWSPVQTSTQGDGGEDLMDSVGPEAGRMDAGVRSGCIAKEKDTGCLTWTPETIQWKSRGL